MKPYPKPHLGRLLTLFAVSLLSIGSARAATINQSVNSTSDSGIHWMGAIWGSPAALPVAGNDYISDGAITSTLRTGSAGSGISFTGDSLTLRNGVNFIVKRNATANYIAQSGAVFSSGVSNRYVSGSILVASGQTTTFHSGTNLFGINALVSGSGSITIQGSGAGETIVSNSANTFAGDWNIAGGALVGLADGAFGDGSATLAIAPGGRFALDSGYNHEFASVTLDGGELAAGTYGWADLSTAQQAFFLQGADQLTVASSSAPAPEPVTYYQIRNHNGGGTWETLADWNTASDGTGTSPTAINATDHFVARHNSWQLRTPGATTTFGGGSLTLASNHYLRVGGSTAILTVPNLITRDNPSLRSGNSQGNVIVQKHHAESGTVELRTLSTSTTPTFNATIGTLTGKGDLLIGGAVGGTVRLTLTDATSFQGDLAVNVGKLDFLAPLSSGGAFVVPVPADVTLNHSAIFTGLTVNGTAYPSGTYTAAALGFAGTGSVTVRNPANWYLTTSQASGQDWTATHKAHWNANTSGTGGTAPSINIVDTYHLTVGSNVLRTPAASSTFLGGTLNLGGSGQLVLAGGASAISTVPNLASTGGTINAGTATRNLAVDLFTRVSGTTTLTGGSGGVLNLFAGELKGSGNITIGGTGQFRPFIDEGNGYTGTFTVNSGATLSVQTKFGTAGKLVVNSGGLIVLDDYAYVTGLTVAGSVKPVGTYTAAQLGSGFSGSGRVVVYTRDLDGPPQMFGVNLAGAEFKDNPGFWQTNPAVWDYYNNKGLTLIRLPFQWRRVQSSIGAPVNFTNLDACMALARARGMKVILDMHDYSKYQKGDNDPRIGEPGLPFSAFADVWSQIAARYKDDPAIYGYDLMNEPKGGLDLWAQAAQIATDAIRKQDQTAYVLVEGMDSSSAHKWVNTSGSLDIKDPVGRLIYSAHSYWDTKQSILPNGDQNWSGDGIYISNEPRDPYAGRDKAIPFVEWLQTRPYAHGNFGEYGIPNDYNSADWNIVLGNFLQYLRDNNISGTYWAGGTHWGSYQLSCHPASLTSGPDKAQMSMLELYNND